MTEAEADKKLCPRAIGHGGGNCVGSHCMAWRWHGWRFTKDYGTKREGRLVDNAYRDLEMPGAESLKRFPLDHVGHCGLAGGPE